MDITPIAIKQMASFSQKPSIFLKSSALPSEEKDDVNVEDLSGKKSIFEKVSEGQNAQPGSGIEESADINMKNL